MNIINLKKRTFKEIHSFEDRYRESGRMLYKYRDRLPIICEKYPNSSKIPDIKKHKYLAPMELTIGNFIYIIRQNIEGIQSNTALFLCINDFIPPTSVSMITLYEKYKYNDGFLYINYLLEIMTNLQLWNHGYSITCLLFILIIIYHNNF